MNNEIKREVNKIEIPEELHARAELGIKQAKQEDKKSKRYPKWVIGTAASLIIVGATFSIGNSSIADATETLLVKILNTEEQAQFQEDIQKAVPEDPEGGAKEAEAALQQMEQHLAFAKEYLSPEEFEDYSQLMKESMVLNAELLINPADEKIEKRQLRLQKEIDKYGLYKLTNHTIEEARAMASYPINYPVYVPEGYELIEAEAITEEAHAEEDPRVTFQYHQTDGEMNFYIDIEKIDPMKEDDLIYDYVDSYELNGYAFEHAYDEQTIDTGNVQGMRITIPEEGYEITIHASLLSKEEMEKILLSMV